MWWVASCICFEFFVYCVIRTHSDWWSAVLLCCFLSSEWGRCVTWLPATLRSPPELLTFPFSWGKNRLNQQVLPCSPHLQWGCLFPLSVPIYNLPLTHHPRLTEKIIVCCGVCLLFVWFSEWKVKLFNLVKSWKTLPFLLHTHHSTATHKGLYKGERVGLGYLTRFLDTVSRLGLTWQRVAEECVCSRWWESSRHSFTLVLVFYGQHPDTLSGAG